jgi:hypothetical protein
MWLGLALIATLLSIWLKVATALSEIVVGTIAQLIIGATAAAFLLAVDDSAIKFLSGAGAIVLTFLAGAELDPQVFRRKWKEASAVGQRRNGARQRRRLGRAAGRWLFRRRHLPRQRRRHPLHRTPPEDFFNSLLDVSQRSSAATPGVTGVKSESAAGLDRLMTRPSLPKKMWKEVVNQTMITAYKAPISPRRMLRQSSITWPAPRARSGHSSSGSSTKL